MIKNGDTIGVLALSGNCDSTLIDKGVKNLLSLGYNVKLSKNIYAQNNYLAGKEEEKIEELHRFFLDSDVKLILNARGGYGALRIINKIDYNLIKSNPKPFCGFSDITALLLMIYKKTGLITYHSPMLCSDFVEINDFTIQNFYRALKNEPLEIKASKVYKSGNVQGITWGGNLATVASLCGLDFIPNKNFIFFTEDLNEPVYKIDRMLTQLFNIEKFKKNCKGIIIGEFLNIDNAVWLADLLQSLDVPTINIPQITHAKEKLTIPIGKPASIENNLLRI